MGTIAQGYDRIGVNTATTGTGTVTLGAVITDSTNGDYLTFADAGVPTGTNVPYLIVDGNNFEIGLGTYTLSGTTLTRSVTVSKISGTKSTTLLTLSGNAKVYVVLSAALAFSLANGGVQIQDDGTIVTAQTIVCDNGIIQTYGTTAGILGSSASSSYPAAQFTNTTADASACQFIFAKSRAGAATQNGDSLGAYYFEGTDTTPQFIQAGIFQCVQTGASGSFTVPAAFRFITQAGTISVPTGTDTLATRAAAEALSNKTIGLAAGTTSVAPVQFTSGTNLTTPVAGALEYDGSVLYATTATIGRGLLEVEQWAVGNTDKTLTSTTTAQAAFNTSANGAIGVGIGTYEFECMLNLASMSATSGSFGFALAGTATKTQFWNSEANKVATLATASSSQNTYNTTNANATLATANVNTLGYALMKGVIRVTVAGTIIPQVSLGVAAAALVKAGSYFRIKQLSGSATFLSVGNWS
jgi:hypothetical protein